MAGITPDAKIHPDRAEYLIPYLNKYLPYYSFWFFLPVDKLHSQDHGPGCQSTTRLSKPSIYRMPRSTETPWLCVAMTTWTGGHVQQAAGKRYRKSRTVVAIHDLKF